MWYKVVTFGSPTNYTRKMLGNPFHRTGRAVSRDLDECVVRAKALQGHVSTVRVLGCPTRAQARKADISDKFPVVWS